MFCFCYVMVTSFAGLERYSCTRKCLGDLQSVTAILSFSFMRDVLHQCNALANCEYIAR